MPLNPLNHHYAIENPASQYDEEAMTALELAGRTTAKVNEAVKAFNKLEADTNTHLENQDRDIETRMEDQDDRLTQMETKQIPRAVTDAVQEKIESGEFDTAIDQYAGNLSNRVDNLLGKVTEGSTTGDAELIDARTNEQGQVHTNVGNAIRRNATNVAELRDKLLVTGENLLNPNSMKEGFYVNQLSGAIEVNVTHSASNYIPITPDTTYTVNLFYNYGTPAISTLRVAFYTCDYQFISGHIGTKIVTAPANGVYMAVSCHKDYTVQVIQGEVDESRRSYTETLNPSLLDVDQFNAHLQPTVNLACEAFREDGIFVDHTYGAYPVNSAHHTYKMIPIKENSTYSIATYKDGNYSNDGVRVAIFNRNGEYMKGWGLAITNTDPTHITTPSGARYMSVSGYIAHPIMVCEGDELLPYEPYKGYIHPGYINTYTKQEIDNKLTGNAEMTVNLPNTLYALVGEELNIYFDNLVDGKDTDYTFDVACDAGMQLERCYRITPTADQVGGHNLDIMVTSKRSGVSVTKRATIKIAPANAGQGVRRSVIILGDSTTNNGICVTKLNDNFAGDVMNISTLGTRGGGINKHEGRSGWSYNLYFTKQGDTTVANPFYNPETSTFDAGYYFRNQGVSVPDYFIINLGINDTFNGATDATLTQLNGYTDAMIASVRSACPDAKICIALTIPPNYSQDAFGKGYSNGQTRDAYKHNNHVYVRNLITQYGGREAEGIYLIPIHTNLDTKYNMGMEEIQVNKRNTKTYSSPVANGGVHPDTNGYWQIADAYWFFIKNMEV